MIRAFIVGLVIVIMPLLAISQQPKDTIPKRPTLVISDNTGKVKEEVPIRIDSTKMKDSIVKPKHSPRKAAIRSAIIPGWGQAYNKKYWKVPIVWAAVGIPAWLVYYNQEWYKRTSYAVKVSDVGNNMPVYLEKVDPQLLPLVTAKQTPALINYRNDFRKNRDYAILFGLLFWGLNIVDATVDAHLKDFDVSEDLSLYIKPTILPGNAPGLSFVLSLNNNRSKTISSLR
ncbi:DUF5683 domain-containing protein [Paraflavitalea sp. CAU 1676]|uniref:DUF5683 domain-containing protein n=1 Tax=Paraflavitalea sp. CAU 1676 TaxID=3032598 RepID=UPI0023DAC8EE|nr:DUF5683 domain-containing protein [Paraflavitalea sp. CAU 1676]MDF2189501.1 DUF5683 domain-containing protein [Paraflavitalea sp. CAU 1676]